MEMNVENGKKKSAVSAETAMYNNRYPSLNEHWLNPSSQTAYKTQSIPINSSYPEIQVKSMLWKTNEFFSGNFGG